MKKNRCFLLLGAVLPAFLVFGLSFPAWAVPRLHTVSPDHGPRGGTNLTVTGENFSPGDRFAIWGGGVYIKNSVATIGSANALYCSGSYAYLACGDTNPDGQGVQIINIHDPNRPQSIHFFPLAQQASDILVFGNYAYVASGSGLQILDIHDPDSPSPVSAVPPFSTNGKVVNISIYGAYSYLAIDDGGSPYLKGGLQIVDISSPEQPVTVSFCEFPANGYALDVVAEGTYAYLAAGSAGFKIIDTADPEAPRLITSFLRPGRFVCNVYKYQNHLYLSEKDYGIEIVDVSDPYTPVLISSFTTPGLAYKVAIRGNYLYVADYLRGISVFDHNPPHCTLVGFQATPGLAMDLHILGDYIFVADGGGGLQILDAVNPRNPSIASMIGLLDHRSIGLQVKGLHLQGSYAYVYSRSSGSEPNWLKILNISNPKAPWICNEDEQDTGIEDNPGDLAVIQDYAYLVDEDRGLQIIDVSEKRDPVRLTSWSDDPDTRGGRGILVRDNHLLLADSLDNCKAALKVFSLDTNLLPFLDSHICLSNDIACAEAVCAAGDYALVAAGAAGVEIFHTPPSGSPSFQMNVPLAGYIKDISLSGLGRYAFCAARLPDGKGLIQTLNIGTITDPQLVGSCVTVHEPRSLSPDGNYLYAAEGEAGLQVIDIGDPENPLGLSLLQTLTPAEDVASADEFIYVATENGVMVIHALKPCPVVSYVDETTLHVSTPSGLASGSYNLTVTDPNGYSSVIHNGFTVEDNRPPHMVPVNPALSVYEGQELTFTIEADDPDGDQLTYSASKLPTGASLNSTRFSWTPGFDDAGIYYDIHLTVSDGELITDQEITIFVFENSTSTAPELQPIGHRQIAEGATLSLTLSAAHPEAASLFFSASPLPTGATLSGNLFSWTPGYDQSGVYTIVFTVREQDLGLSDSEEIQITVLNTNRPPVLTLPPSHTTREGIVMTFLIKASDPDPGDTPGLEFSMIGAPAGATLRPLTCQSDKATACFLWTPGYSQGGIYTLSFKVKDRYAAYAQKPTSLQVQQVAASSFTVEFQAGATIWLCPAGRNNYTSFNLLKDLGEKTIYALEAYDWDLTLLHNCCWLFGQPGGENFPMHQSHLYIIYAKKDGSFSWFRDL